MNELKDFDQWKSTFKAVNDHLNRDGLFIFDVLTPKILRYASSLSATRPFSKGYYFDRAIVKGNSLTWDVKIFKRLSNGLYQLNEYSFPERIYPVARMKSVLSERFDILETNLREEGRNILFVCRKK
jgi:hypothetical protein